MKHWVSPSKAERLDAIQRHARELFHHIARYAWWNNTDDIRGVSDSLAELQRLVEQLYRSETRCLMGHVIIPGGDTCTQCGAREVETS